VSAHVVNLPEVTKGSPDRFGYSWDRYADVLPEHEEQFLRWTTLDRSFWQGVRFLDGGCGIGRNAYWPMTYGARGGVAVDVDDRTLARLRGLGQFLKLRPLLVNGLSEKVFTTEGDWTAGRLRSVVGVEAAN
jgi:SAM-dependent methyltransferase